MKKTKANKCSSFLKDNRSYGFTSKRQKFRKLSNFNIKAKFAITPCSNHTCDPNDMFPWIFI